MTKRSGNDAQEPPSRRNAAGQAINAHSVQEHHVTAVSGLANG
jgi:hypothetical protein